MSMTARTDMGLLSNASDHSFSLCYMSFIAPCSPNCITLNSDGPKGVTNTVFFVASVTMGTCLYRSYVDMSLAVFRLLISLSNQS